MSRFVTAGSILALALSACGPTPPDYDSLARHEVEACGEVFTADVIVRRAYEGSPKGDLPASIDAPGGTVAVSYLERSGADLLRRYPCADDVSDARRLLAEMDYKNPILVHENDHAVFFEAIDTYGISSTYSILLCDFVGDVTARRSGSLYHQGLFGEFGENGGEPPDDSHIRDLASITFATGMTQLADEGTARLVEGVTLLGSEEDVREVDHPGVDEDTLGIGVCVTWVEPNLWGGCDAIRVGMSRTVMLNHDSGEFHQVAIHSLIEGFYGFAGWCGRRE